MSNIQVLLYPYSGCKNLPHFTGNVCSVGDIEEYAANHPFEGGQLLVEATVHYNIKEKILAFVVKDRKMNRTFYKDFRPWGLALVRDGLLNTEDNEQSGYETSNGLAAAENNGQSGYETSDGEPLPGPDDDNEPWCKIL